MSSKNGQAKLLKQSRHAARSAGLNHVTDGKRGISRKRRGSKFFIYVGPDGKRITNQETLHRIRLLAIPPAWTEVWIAPTGRGHIQAVGRDARHRKQYRYHSKWREVRDESKYGRLLQFARMLPSIRKRVRRDLARAGLPREKILAAVVAVMEKTFIRVGNDEYARHNGSFGLTTLRDHHARAPRGGRKIVFEFRGKSGREHAIELNDPRLARIVREARDLPGRELFQYQDDDKTVRDVSSSDINQYLRDITGVDVTAKDFRTWAGTVMAAEALRELGAFDSKAQAKKNILRAVERVAERLGNTTTVCRKGYIHPEVLNAYLDRSMIDAARQRAAALGKHLSKLKPEEAAVVALLQRRLAKDKSAHTRAGVARSSSSQKPRAA